MYNSTSFHFLQFHQSYFTFYNFISRFFYYVLCSCCILWCMSGKRINIGTVSVHWIRSVHDSLNELPWCKQGLCRWLSGVTDICGFVHCHELIGTMSLVKWEGFLSRERQDGEVFWMLEGMESWAIGRTQDRVKCASDKLIRPHHG